MEAALTSAVPDGTPRQLDPQFIAFQRVAGWIFTAFVACGLFFAAIVVWLTAELPKWGNLLLPPAWLAFSAGLAIFCYAWPMLEYRRTSYVLDDRGIEIRSGVLWRAVTNIPRSRVQHIDVSQGPLERAYGLGRLVIYTAGTDHSRIELPGLGYHVAFALRNHLLPRGDDDAV
ncbi:MAG TPA: PH domain-containing protein [Vicinamibacterales bacterium]|jgi:membrane protein YdbS with pleckstrin-like domain